jgi:prevent-host-death family protein
MAVTKHHHKRTVTASEARAHFATLLDAVAQGEEVTITKHGEVVATLTPAHEAVKKHVIPPPGFLQAQGWTVAIAPDFDEVPEGFEDYV